MGLPTARSRDEAHLYLDLTPCATCDSVETDWQHGQALVDGELVSAYDGRCAGCGAEREYFFRLPNQEVGGEFPAFGGDEPSDLIDAGRWLALADQLASNLPPHDPEASAQALAIAAAAVGEVLKFIPRDEYVVPASAFWTAEGLRVRDAEPGRFRRERLEVVLGTYRGLSE